MPPSGFISEHLLLPPGYRLFRCKHFQRISVQPGRDVQNDTGERAIIRVGLESRTVRCLRSLLRMLSRGCASTIQVLDHLRLQQGNG